jgi:protein PhnA
MDLDSCQLCGDNKNLTTYKVEPRDDEIVVCAICDEQINNTSKIDPNHWHCLNDSMWSEVNGVKVVAYRMLSILNNQDLLDMMYLEDDIRQWANYGLEKEEDEKLIYKDSNGITLNVGDTVVIIKDLPVKGAGFTAKQGVSVRNISLVPNDETHIAGRVNGIKIHLKTCFLKKS